MSASEDSVFRSGIENELEHALAGTNGYGGNVAEIYAYRLAPASLRDSSAIARAAAQNLTQILRDFVARHGDAVEVGVEVGRRVFRPINLRTEEIEPFSHRVHIQVQRRDQGERTIHVYEMENGRRIMSWPDAPTAICEAIAHAEHHRERLDAGVVLAEGPVEAPAQIGTVDELHELGFATRAITCTLRDGAWITSIGPNRSRDLANVTEAGAATDRLTPEHVRAVEVKVVESITAYLEQCLDDWPRTHSGPETLRIAIEQIRAWAWRDDPVDAKGASEAPRQESDA